MLIFYKCQVYCPFLSWSAPVAELVDAPDSKSGGFRAVSVRVRPGAPHLKKKKRRRVGAFFNLWNFSNARWG